MHLGTSAIVLLVIAAPLGLLLAALLLRSACDLCSVEPSPPYLRCVILTLVVLAAGAPLVWCSRYAATTLGASLAFGDDLIVIVTLAVFLPVYALLSTLIFVPSFRVRPVTGVKIWLVNTLITSVVAAVVGLIFVGGWTTVDGIRRLF